ncbi:hypothetical protein [Bacillus cereus]|uniref:hypothetical protein n=1 Tax=Bacillus cereus TaxID=1396 RepID=UPI000BF3C17D|nr:hypothetical protein [Bacillus cereus]MDF3555411.1 hypothetical protein [Bacillus cereus]PEY32657.1 hypothetical protein CN347_21570 [Bacillus cereus]PGM02917.1 hypothetical protein CN935_27345 [Bacillus cereus]PGZ85406.1 hypothetical protein COE64_15775 [Bacillus cereus]
MGELKGVNHYFIRFLYLLSAWCIAIKPIFLSDTTTKSTFCSTLFLFFVPLVIDYWGMTVHSRIGNILKHVGVYTTILPIVLVFCINFDGLDINLTTKTMYGISFYGLWWGLFLWVALSFVDWVYFSFNTAEKQVSEEIVSEIRKGLRYNIPNPMESRIDYHEKQYEAEIAASNEGGIKR